MSSMLPVHRGSFWSYLPVPGHDCCIINAIVLRDWLDALSETSQAEKLTLAARQGATALPLDPNTKPWLITYASQTGVSEQLAWRTATALQEARQPVSVKAVQQLSLEDLQQAEQVLFVASTYGTGEAPDLASSLKRKFCLPKWILIISIMQFWL